jgi:hypothetical protein
MVTTLQPLITRVEALEGADREVDALVCAAAGYAPPRCGTFVRFPGRNPIVTSTGALVTVTDEAGRGGYSGPAPPFTASVDDVLALVGEKLPGWVIGMQQNEHPEEPNRTQRAWSAWIEKCGSSRGEDGACFEVTTRTPALALLCAFLKALAQKS